MKVLLVKPYSDSHLIAPPLGLGYLATAIRDKHEVAILDCVKEHIREGSFQGIIKTRKPDVVGFQIYSQDVQQVKRCLAIVKNIDPGIVTLIGGPHPSCIPNDSMEFFKEADFGFCGEAESGLPMLLDRLAAGTGVDFSGIPGFMWRGKDGIMINKNEYQQNLDSLGFVSWDLLMPQNYPRAAVQGGFVKNFPVAPMIVTRGCPYLCTYCAGPLIFGRRVRARSVDHVIKEIELLYEKYGIREIQIVDDHFLFNTNYVKDFCRKMIDKSLDLTFYGVSGVRIDAMDEEMLHLMRKAGFYHIAVGIESGSDRILKMIKKSMTVDNIRRNVGGIRKSGLDVIGFFIIGFPGETKEDILRTIDLACELDLKRASFSFCQPLPGTEIYNSLKKSGKLDKGLQWERLHFSKISFVPDKLSYAELKRLQRYAFFRFMLRPRIIIRHLKEISSFHHLLFLFKRFVEYIVKR